LDNTINFENVKYLIKESINVDELELFRVSTFVNSTRNEGIKCLEKIFEKKNNSIMNYFKRKLIDNEDQNEKNKKMKFEEIIIKDENDLKDEIELKDENDLKDEIKLKDENELKDENVEFIIENKMKDEKVVMKEIKNDEKILENKLKLETDEKN
jgi:hypothetical protein